MPLSLEHGEWMLGLTSLEVQNYVIIKTTENKKFEIHRSKEEKCFSEQARYSLTGLNNDDRKKNRKFQNKDVRRPIVIDKLKAKGFINVNIVRKLIHLTEGEINSVITSNNAKFSVHILTLKGYEQSCFQDLESFFRRNKLEESNTMFFVQKKANSTFATNEIPPGVYEVSHFKSILNNSKTASVSFDIVTIEKKLKKRTNF